MRVEHSFYNLLSITIAHMTESVGKWPDFGKLLKVLPGLYSSNVDNSYLNWDFNLKFEVYQKYDTQINENFVTYLAE